MSVRIKTGDTVKIIAGAAKGQTGKVTKVLPAENKVFVEGYGKRTRHMRGSAYRQAGKTSRVGYAKDKDGKTVRIARQANNREIK